MRVAVVAVLMACGSSSAPPPDADDRPLDYQLRVGFDSTRADMPQVFIDGVATMSVEQVYPSLSDPIRHDIELRYADQVLAHTFAIAQPGGCDPTATNVRWTSIVQGVSALVSGDVRYGGDEWQGDGPDPGTMTVCTGDGFALPDCRCQATERCAPRVTRAQPLFTRMACTPIGTKAAGDPCTMTDDPAGAYDDCGANLFCLAGTCTAFCSDPSCPCPTVPGYPPEVRRCN